MHQPEPQSLTRWLQLIQTQYLEMPGLQLTKPQVQRLWALDEPTCDAVLDALVNAHFLTRTGHKTYVLASATRSWTGLLAS